METKTNATIENINELLSWKLEIPPYQRPYKWDTKNVDDLINDILEAIKDSKKYENYRYRIGTIILHEKEESKFDIVDGQQRIISLILIKKYIETKFDCPILSADFKDKISQKNIHNNYMHIKETLVAYISDEKNKEELIKAFSETLEVVVISVSKESEAFQLFDSQNTRGKRLNPHDLLKAYHLREMRDYPYEMRHAVTKWEAKKAKEIRVLFNSFLFPIWNWCRGDLTKTFTDKEIAAFKGISQSSPYYYARRTGNAMPYFQITEPFISGNDFFEMVDHYLQLKEDIEMEISGNKKFRIINEIIENEKYTGNTGFNYAKNLFYCALLCYYDKFHNFDPLVIKKLFLWAFMIRLDMEHLGQSTINNYAIGKQNTKYSNNIALFSVINRARLHTEISCLTLNKPNGKEWSGLKNDLEKINETEAALND